MSDCGNGSFVPRVNRMSLPLCPGKVAWLVDALAAPIARAQIAPIAAFDLVRFLIARLLAIGPSIPDNVARGLAAQALEVLVAQLDVEHREVFLGVLCGKCSGDRGEIRRAAKQPGELDLVRGGVVAAG